MGDHRFHGYRDGTRDFFIDGTTHIATNVLLENGGRLDVLGNGIADTTTVNQSSILAVATGGKAQNIVMHDGGVVGSPIPAQRSAVRTPPAHWPPTAQPVRPATCVLITAVSSRYWVTAVRITPQWVQAVH